MNDVLAEVYGMRPIEEPFGFLDEETFARALDAVAQKYVPEFASQFDYGPGVLVGANANTPYAKVVDFVLDEHEVVTREEMKDALDYFDYYIHEIGTWYDNREYATGAYWLNCMKLEFPEWEPSEFFTVNCNDSTLLPEHARTYFMYAAQELLGEKFDLAWVDYLGDEFVDFRMGIEEDLHFAQVRGVTVSAILPYELIEAVRNFKAFVNDNLA